LTDDDTAVGNRAEAGTQALTLAHGGDSRARPRLRAHHRQRPHGVGTADTVSRGAAVRLKFLESTRRRGAEDAIDPAAVEAEPTEAGLQVGDIVAAQVR
jgi:hypothetical protein